MLIHRNMERITIAMEYVELNLSKKIELIQIANASGMSPHHFSRAFKTITGETPMRYVLNRRVQCIKRKIDAGRNYLLPLSDICGFCNQSHMTRAFKAIVGVTPAQYMREQIRPPE